MRGPALLEARRSAQGLTRSSVEPSTQSPQVACKIETVSPGHEIATITVCNPRKLNIVNKAVPESLVTTCEALSSNEVLRAVVLTGGLTAVGKQPSFIVGTGGFIDRVHVACAAFRDLPMPVIARIHGFALGAGLRIAASCDLCIATGHSFFAMPEVKIGIPSVIEAAHRPGLIGMGRTRRHLYLAKNISADEAKRWGLAERVVADETELDAAVKNWMGRMIELVPKAVRSQKRLMQNRENVGVDDGVAAGVEAFGTAYEDGGVEPRELMASFVGRKKTKL